MVDAGANRKNFPWSDEEDERLMNSITNNLSFEEVSKLHQRTVKSLKYRVLRNCALKIKEGMDIESVATKYKIPYEVISDYIKEAAAKKAVTPQPEAPIDHHGSTPNDLMKTMNLMIATLIRDVGLLSKRMDEVNGKLDQILMNK